jgi:zinc protease
VDGETLQRAKVKFRSRFYDMMGEMVGIGKLDLLASFALFDGDPSRVNAVETEIRKVTPELIQKTAQEFLRPTNQTVVALTVNAGSR